MHLTFTTVWQYTAGIHEYDYIVTTHHSKPVLSKVTLLPTLPTFGQSESQMHCLHLANSLRCTAYIWPIRVSDALPTFGQSLRCTAYIWPIRVSDALPTFGQSESQMHCLHLANQSLRCTAYIWPIRVSDALPTFGQSECQMHCLHLANQSVRCTAYI